MKFLTFTCLVLVVVVQVSRGDETKVEKQGYIMSNPTSNMGSLYGSMSQSQPASNNQYSSGGYSSGQSGSGQSSGGYYNMANQQQQQQASYGQQPSSSGSSSGYGQQSGSQGLIKIYQNKYTRSF